MQRASQIFGHIVGASSPKSKRLAQADPLQSSAPLFDREGIVCAAWARAVGKKIAQHTRPSKLVRNRLVVEVEDAGWQRSLFTLRGFILTNLEKALGSGVVEELEFRVMPRRREPQLALSATQHAPPRDESDEIGDPGLRRIYRAARQKESA